ncbi:MAG: hypothetical protein VYB54_12325 [Pseudomonadota bacterium]|nr:hypothetical protein [Pseudomonadota bacterium]
MHSLARSAALVIVSLAMVSPALASDWKLAQTRTNDPDPADVADQLLERLQSPYYDVVDGSLRRAQREVVDRIPMRAVTSRGGTELVDVRYATGTGEILTDATGHALYASRLDRIDGKSSLTAEQLKQWIPLTVSADYKTSHLWGKAWSDAGQVWILTFAGKPLYTYAADSNDARATGRGGPFYTMEVIH